MRYKIPLILDNDDGKGPTRREVVVIARADSGASAPHLTQYLRQCADTFVAWLNENPEGPRATIITGNPGRRTGSKNQK